jgi:hypothetical protein
MSAISPAAKRCVLVLLLTFFAGVRDHGLATTEDFSLRDEVFVALKQWESATNIAIAQGARVLVQSGFSSNEEILKTAYDKQHLSSKQQKFLLDALVAHYLYDLRDKKLKFDEFAKAISEGDVKNFPPEQFISAMRHLLDNEVGYLDVLSEPDLANIAIDGDRKDERSCRTFVVSPGSHKVREYKLGTRVDCSEQVNVSPQETRSVSCPKGDIMRCHVPGAGSKGKNFTMP